MWAWRPSKQAQAGRKQARRPVCAPLCYQPLSRFPRFEGVEEWGADADNDAATHAQLPPTLPSLSSRGRREVRLCPGGSPCGAESAPAWLSARAQRACDASQVGHIRCPAGISRALDRLHRYHENAEALQQHSPNKTFPSFYRFLWPVTVTESPARRHQTPRPTAEARLRPRLRFASHSTSWSDIPSSCESEPCGALGPGAVRAVGAGNGPAELEPRPGGAGGAAGPQESQRCSHLTARLAQK